MFCFFGRLNTLHNESILSLCIGVRNGSLFLGLLSTLYGQVCAAPGKLFPLFSFLFFFMKTSSDLSPRKLFFIELKKIIFHISLKKKKAQQTWNFRCHRKTFPLSTYLPRKNDTISQTSLLRNYMLGTRFLQSKCDTDGFIIILGGPSISCRK